MGWKRASLIVFALVGEILLAGRSAADENSSVGLTIRRSGRTGLATFVTATDGGPVPVPVAAGKRVVEPRDFLVAHGHLFGVTDARLQLKVEKAHTDWLGRTHTTFQQVHDGVPVFSGVLKVHQEPNGAVIAGNGHFHPRAAKVNTQPKLEPQVATTIARRMIGHGQPTVEHSELVIVDPGWYGNPPQGAHLAYYIVLADLSVPLREAFFVDAHTGKILERWSLLHTGLYRRVWNDQTSAWVRLEEDPPTGDPDADAAYNYTGDVYGYFSRAFGRDGYDNEGSDMGVTVHLQSSSCPNAFGGGGWSYFCTGTASDDVVAHEWGHSITSWTADLIYWNQAGQLNESYSDIWGEMIDLLNGNRVDPGDEPSGPPYWPTTTGYVGPGTDTPNALRTSGACVSGVALDVNAPPSIAGTYLAGPANFGPALDETGVTGDVALAEPALACDPITNPSVVNGKIALVDRGDCYFTTKVKNCQDAGAIAVIVANNRPGPPITMAPGTPDVITIPSVMIVQVDGASIRSTVEGGTTVNATMRANSSAEGVRWLVSEDASAFGGAIRDMWEPTCYGDPDRANHPFQVCNPDDNGGVHSGSGTPNHAFAIMSDGKTFNGYTVNGIGIIKAGAVWYYALITYLTPASDFEDAYWALNQTAADLTDTMVIDPRDGSDYGLFTSADAAEVDKALLATEMNTEGLCGASGNVVDPDPPDKCPDRTTLYFDDFELDVDGWSVSNTGPFGPPTPYDWEWITTGGLPFGWPGSVWHCQDRSVGNCDTQDESAVHSLFSPVIVLPTDPPLSSPTLAFSHYLDAEWAYDGGNVRIRVDGGDWQLIPGSAFQYNPYNDVLASAAAGNTNPLAGEEAWTGFSMLGGGWGTSLVDLSGYVSGGDEVEFRFDFGKNGCTGWLGWYVDDFELYSCPPSECPVSDPPTAPSGEAGYQKIRYISMVPGNPGRQSALRVTLNTLPPPFNGFNGTKCWVGEPRQVSENAGKINHEPGWPDFWSANLDGTPYCMDWGMVGVLHVTDDDIIPGAVYDVQAIDCECDFGNEADYSAPLTITTSGWGDLVGTCAVIPCSPPDGVVGIPTDVTAVLDKFKNLANAVPKSRADIEPNFPDWLVNMTDVTQVLDAFRGCTYSDVPRFPFCAVWSGPGGCP
ncbi:MAG: M4 family metallopeptidase [Phycisphaerales bacterium]|nr:MAG: M4 family metallopeptidase [Phycisphaerales bacterium]